MAATDRFTTEEDLVMRPGRWGWAVYAKWKDWRTVRSRRDLDLNMKI